MYQKQIYRFYIQGIYLGDVLVQNGHNKHIKQVLQLKNLKYKIETKKKNYLGPKIVTKRPENYQKKDEKLQKKAEVGPRYVQQMTRKAEERQKKCLTYVRKEV